MDWKRCTEGRLVERMKPQADLIKKELEEADYDLERAGEAFENNDFKWTIVKAYFAMFHGARAVMFANGYRERRHFVVGLFLEKLSKKGILEERFPSSFIAAIDAREKPTTTTHIRMTPRNIFWMPPKTF
jgi:uncharacterized protein (UPF0332 family)